MPTGDPLGRGSLLLAVLLTALVTAPRESAAQSLTAGSLRGVVRTKEGNPLPGASLTLEGRLGGVVKELETDLDGAFRIPLLPTGEYRLLVEQVGYQPIRRSGIEISAGEVTVVSVLVERRPPPIVKVTEIDAAAPRIGSASGRFFGSRELDRFDRRREASDALRDVSEVVWPTDGRDGFGLAASGLPFSFSRVMVDGIYEPVLRHPGLPAEPIPTPLLHRDGVGQLRVIGAPLDAEWRGTPGTLFALQSRSGSNRLSFAPYLTGSSASLGGRSVDNPLDSTSTSLQVGAVLSGAIVPDTAHFLLRVDYQSLEQPTAYPWEHDSSAYRGAAVSLREQIPLIGSDSFGTSLGRFVNPTVRTWKGATGLGKLEWQLSPTQRVGARFAFADWRERSPQLGELLASGVGTSVKGRDFAGGLWVTSAGPLASNELRVGFSANRRQYEGSGLPATFLVSEGIALGTPTALPAFFDAKTVDFSDAFQYPLGRHQLKGGLSTTFTNYQQDYRYGATGVYQFGDLDRFGRAQGTFYQTVGSEAPRFTQSQIGLFVQDSWSATPEVQVILGLRYEVSPIPKNKISFNSAWFGATGVRNDSLKTNTKAIAPRIGFVWDVQNRGEWVVRGGLGVHYGNLDPATFAEAMLFDGSVKVRRGFGSYPSWPAVPDSALAPTVGPGLTIINRTYRPPRALKAEVGVSGTLGSGFTLHLSGSYHHADFLLQRTDLNRVVSAVGTTQEGRPVYGRLAQEGGFVTTVPGSNRRFDDFDLVSGLAPTGFADYYALTATLERRVTRDLAVVASYTYSKTTDDLTGARSADPADQLSPFPERLSGVDWVRGRSDFDIPHRFAGTVEYRSPGRTPLTLQGRYRIRSGLPFTPGFRPGVDPNGDGSGSNDPAFLDPSIAGLGEALGAGGCSLGLSSQFAERNSCREKMQQALDLHFSVGLPYPRGRNSLSLQVDAFNVVSTETGIVDRAAVLVDPTRSLVTDGAGNLTLPLMANPRFGTLLARRGEPRVVRIGLRMEY